jgi:hypothetical protein
MKKPMKDESPENQSEPPIHKGAKNWAKYKNIKVEEKPTPVVPQKKEKVAPVETSSARAPRKGRVQPNSANSNKQTPASSSTAVSTPNGFQFPDNGWVCRQC